MAELILACARGGRPQVLGAGSLRAVAARLEPFDDAPPPPRVVERAGVIAALAVPSAHGTRVEQAGRDAAGVCVGALMHGGEGWARPGTDLPDGTWALARWDGDGVELATDACGSRALWYAQTDDAFLASTSQRALVMLLRSFEPDPEAMAWLLSSASLGPEVSWDARIRRVPPAARVTLGRSGWRLSISQASSAFAASGDSEDAQLARLRTALADACTTLDIAYDHWVLPLSGGCDSRILLANLVAAGVRPRCVTWSRRESLRNPLSDASVARVVARRVGVEHEIVFLDDEEIDPDLALDRFVAAGEGLTDEFGGYVDGLVAWRDLRAAGVEGVIRGDEPLGDRRAPETEAVAIVRNGGPRAIDYPGDHVIRHLGLAHQHVPEYLKRLPGEDLHQYQVRLCQVAWVPVFLANLHGPKARFVEIANPMLSRRFVDVVRSLSPRLLSHERAFLRLVADVTTTIPTARYSSTDALGDLLSRPAMLELVVRELTAPEMEAVLLGDGAHRVLTTMIAEAAAAPDLTARARAALQHASAFLPIRLAAAMRPGWNALSLDARTLAFRAVLARRTLALLEQDARSLTVPEPDPGQAFRAVVE